MQLTADHAEGTCECAELIERNDTVIVPDLDGAIGTVRALMEHTAAVEISESGMEYTYKLADLHLTDSAAAMKDA